MTKNRSPILLPSEVIEEGVIDIDAAEARIATLEGGQ